MDQSSKDQDTKQNSPNSQTTASSQNSTTPSSPILSDDTSSPESVITELKNDIMLSHPYQHHHNDDEEHDDRAASALASPPAGLQLQSPRFSCYDGGRIPGSIFTRPGTPGGWSVASNESLFSIHVGNYSCTSFSATPMFRSGELSSKQLEGLGHGHGHQTAPFPRVNEALYNHSCAWPRAAEPGGATLRDDSDVRSHLSTQSFQFPVLPGGRDGGWISSPKMLELKRQRTAEQILQPPQSLMHIMQRRKQPQRFSKSKNDHSNIISRLFCFSKYCCTPCRRNGA